MVEVLCGMGGSLIVFIGFFAGYWLGSRQPKVTAEEKEEQTTQLTMEEQLSNMMNYRGE